MQYRTKPRWRKNYPMSRLSSWKAGGRARYLFTPQSLSDLIYVLNRSPRKPLLWVGHGSNLLVRDGGLNGIAVHTAVGMTTIRVEKENTVYAEVGVSCAKLARFCSEKGLAGAEFLVGIPGTVGGALAMNAGCYGSEIWNQVIAVQLLRQGKVETASPDQFEIGYRWVKKDTDTVFLGAWLGFQIANPEHLKQKVNDYLKKRNQTQPIGTANSGSVFCNPKGDYAGRLIESCGLKGKRVGDATVSMKHANFIINHGKASATDIENLITLIQNEVSNQTGFILRVEAQIVGERV